MQHTGAWDTGRDRGRDRGRDSAPAFCAALSVPEAGCVNSSGSAGGDLAGKDEPSVQADMETEEKGPNGCSSPSPGLCLVI